MPRHSEQVVALWSEGHAAGAGPGGSQERMLARVRRFYRPEVRREGVRRCCQHRWCMVQNACIPSFQSLLTPPTSHSPTAQETPFAGIAAPGQLFRSNHIDDRLGLAAVQRRCHVALLAAGQHAGAGAASGAVPGGQGAMPTFTCQLQLDHEQMVLGVLPPDCLPEQAGNAGADPMPC